MSPRRRERRSLSFKRARGCQLRPTQVTASTPQTVSLISWWHEEQWQTRICVSVLSANGLMLAVCISSPHRHTGNSLKPGTRKRSNADLIPHRVGKPTRIRLALLCSCRLFKIAHLDRSDETPPQQNGCNYIADCAFDEITDRVALEAWLAAIIDVVQNSLSVWNQNLVGRPASVGGHREVRASPSNTI